MKKLSLGIIPILMIIALVFPSFSQQSPSLALTETEVKVGTEIENQVKQGQDALNQTLNAAVASEFDRQTALEVLGRIKIAFLNLENTKLRFANWAQSVTAAHKCDDCKVDLQNKVLVKEPKKKE